MIRNYDDLKLRYANIVKFNISANTDNQTHTDDQTHIDNQLILMDEPTYQITKADTAINLDMIISPNTVLNIDTKSVFVINRRLINYGKINNDGRIIINCKNGINSFFENYGSIINNNKIENYGGFDNYGTIYSNKIVNNGIIKNYGITESEYLKNMGLFNNFSQLIIQIELKNDYIIHNQKTNPITNSETNPIIINHGKIINNHIIHNESIIKNTLYNTLLNQNILINTGKIINSKYTDKLIY